MPGGTIFYRPEAVVYHKVDFQRATLKYVFNFSFREGITRAIVMKLTSQLGHNPLSVENLFLRRLLSTSLLQKLKCFYKLANFAQIGVIIVNVILIGIGYFLGSWKYGSGSK